GWRSPAPWSSSPCTSTRPRSIPLTSRCWRTWSWPPCTTPWRGCRSSTRRRWAGSATPLARWAATLRPWAGWAGWSARSDARPWRTRTSLMYAAPVQELIDELGRLPGIGPKSAQRIAFHLLKLSPEDALRLAAAISAVKERIRFCTRCFNVSEGELCELCTDSRRDPTLVCVVEEPRDIVAVEKTQEFRGQYHVLQGAISPIEGIGPDQLRVRELLSRIETEGVAEVILCTNPNLEGEATAMYLARLLKPLGLRVTRIASGLPVGGDLEYADELTLGRALEGRREVEA